MMKKNYRTGWLLVIIVTMLLLIGCENSNLKEETNSFVINNSYSVIYNDLSSIIKEITMFPTKDKEEKLIYYIGAIKENYTKFNNDELENISNLLDFEYNFNLNELDYEVNDFANDKTIIKSYVK